MSLLFSKFDTYVNVKNIRYAIGMDLSTVSSGMALYDLSSNKLLEVAVIRSDGEDKVYEQALGIIEQIQKWRAQYKIEKDEIVLAKEKQPIQYGMKTTVNTLLSIAKVHGLVEYYCYSEQEILLDIAVPTIRKNVVGNYKADKEEVFAYVCGSYPDLKLDTRKGGKDISDAICVAVTAIVALKGDYQEQMKELKKSIKNYKSSKKQEEILGLIEQIKRKI